MDKVYPSSDTKALDNISFDIRQGEVTALLGHNGAGKSTTIRILTGIETQTSGDVLIGGMDTNIHLETIRNNVGIGVCPQHSVLFAELTCKEHLDFYARLKSSNVSSSSICCKLEFSVDECLFMFELREKQEKIAMEGN